MPRRRPRQCYLGPSAQGTLCLMPQPPQPPPEALGKCCIDMLPDELLAEILAYLPPEPDEYGPSTYEQCPPIALVCKRWEHNYDATLYRNISFVANSILLNRGILKTVKTLRQQADLRKHVRKISVESYYLSEATCREIANTIKSCQSIHTVSLHLNWSTKVWPIIHAVEMLPRLEVLGLSGYESGPSLQMVLGHFNKPTLRDVRLSRYGLARGDTPRAPWLPIDPPSQDEMDKFSTVAHAHSSAITSLELKDPSSSPHCTGILLQWPSNLVRLSLSWLTDSAYGLLYTLDAVNLILNMHRESLQYITVSIIPPSRNDHGGWIASGIPDFSKFQCLRELQLSSRNLLAEKPSQAAGKVAAPGLRQLAINFSTEDQHPESCRAFAEDQVLWIAEFASQNQIREPNTRLQGIFIDFNPGYNIWHLDNNQATTWPWEYLQQAEKEFARYHLTLKYSEPACTKDKWDQMVRDHRKETEAKRGS